MMKAKKAVATQPVKRKNYNNIFLSIRLCSNAQDVYGTKANYNYFF